MKLHLGCGWKKRKGYVNIDKREEVRPDQICDIVGLAYPDDSIEEIYISHVLEHLRKSWGDGVVKRFYKWLKPGGKLYIAVPNLTTVAMFIAEGNEDEILLNWLYGNGEGGEMAHCWGYTEKALRTILKEAGFKVEGYFSGQGDDSDFKFHNVGLSLNLICVK